MCYNNIIDIYKIKEGKMIYIITELLILLFSALLGYIITRYKKIPFTQRGIHISLAIFIVISISYNINYFLNYHIGEIISPIYLIYYISPYLILVPIIALALIFMICHYVFRVDNSIIKSLFISLFLFVDIVAVALIIFNIRAIYADGSINYSLLLLMLSIIIISTFCIWALKQDKKIYSCIVYSIIIFMISSIIFDIPYRMFVGAKKLDSYIEKHDLMELKGNTRTIIYNYKNGNIVYKYEMENKNYMFEYTNLRDDDFEMTIDER